MVRLEEVPDEEILRQQRTAAAAAAATDDDDWEEDDGSDGESDVSDDSEVSERGLALHEESIWERISALRDIIPPSTRRTIASTFNTTTSYAFTGSLLAGKLVWVVTTSALLVGLPFALAVEDESRIVAQEKDMMAQQQGAQHMLAPPAAGASGQPQQQQASAPQGLRPPGF
ncbi:related to TOM22 - mitochondrial outer membrane import receptor complex subunit [Melanopsichium pennsylvanicum]|uniref:Related to TOM22 - mitochondrial outer membrane import receptor complex subunit n=2 Tax=Melanopsichium pennsylvanicum TaxID=63383 RepID=A0AAJ4XH73_9BASI|nr:related to TOM22-mitochondrial outer membrane import receptor complex subunit [Melanopsichium pennsylvanicum 4]SNX82479.1 related to TOM22 - mitochondrial outer membrane import receptor complex subunit [Melanopsichium pennsylvanicum]